ncbi:restriction endonuclease subunit S [Desulforhabdus sp. TSK]|uniref:restriction endonuclease subunit S n=1 Tax=Desulforhabdus sp. TSK TaxID=2925014 RepID=UPI001FC86A6D|nr:restriction endonuclease subunit S [Desulforhabdus sp. TSK]GKT06869.1 type I restriction endonuclease EcoAI subunit S [Desulforhabdus sp. TSK]
MTSSPSFVPSCLRVSELLDQHFDTAFAAPDGIAKLRELILTLAMQGKLVEQDPNDPPTSELLKEIEAEKKRLVKAGKIKQPKPLPPIKPEEVPYQLPQGWEWVRIRDICHDWGQKTPDANFTYIDVGAIDNKLGTIGADTQLLDAANAPSRARKIVKPGTVIYSTVRPYLLNIAIVEKEYDPEPIASTAFAILHPYSSLSNRFVYHYLRSPAFIRYVESTQKGVAYPAINDGDFFSSLFPLPPLLEQRRIVARVDQLMARCDALEKLRKEREQKRLAVHAAAIKQLLDAPDGSAWDFIQQNFGELYTVKENVAELRKAILQLAVMGRLVKQDPNDPPASELLKEIEAEKQRLVKAGKIKKPKPLPPIKPEEIPYELPQGWEWVRFGKVASNRLGKMLDKSKNRGNPKPYLRNTNVQWHQFALDDVKEMKFEDDELDEFRVLPGDLLICEGGEPGRCAIWSDSELETYFQKALHRARPFSCVTSEHLQVCLTNDGGNGQLAKYFTGATIKHFPGDKLNGYVIPLPPLPEQHRIVARIDQLMALCDTLDQQIDAATGKQTELLNAVMAAV